MRWERISGIAGDFSFASAASIDPAHRHCRSRSMPLLPNVRASGNLKDASLVCVPGHQTPITKASNVKDCLATNHGVAQDAKSRCSDHFSAANHRYGAVPRKRPGSFCLALLYGQPCQPADRRVRGRYECELLLHAIRVIPHRTAEHRKLRSDSAAGGSGLVFGRIAAG